MEDDVHGSGAASVVEGLRLGTAAQAPSDESAERESTGIRALAWLDATTLVSVGDEVALWRGEPPALVARGRLPGPTASLEARAAQVVAPCGATVCVWSSEDTRVRRRLSCPRGTAEADGVVVDESGRWVAGHCRSRADLELGEAAVQSCVWAARSGRRARCIETLLPGWASQELAFAPGAELLAVITSNGVELLVPPSVGARSTLPAEVAHDAHVPLAWSPRGDRLAVLNTSVAAIFDVGSGVLSSFEVVGEPLSAAFSPDGEELAVLYREGLVVHAIDGTVRARARRRAERRQSTLEPRRRVPRRGVDRRRSRRLRRVSARRPAARARWSAPARRSADRMASREEHARVLARQPSPSSKPPPE